MESDTPYLSGHVFQEAPIEQFAWPQSIQIKSESSLERLNLSISPKVSTVSSHLLKTHCSSKEGEKDKYLLYLLLADCLSASDRFSAFSI
jgi:hypothetical protein